MTAPCSCKFYRGQDRFFGGLCTPAPLPGSGDGGAGGKGGIQGQEHTEEANITGTTLTWYVIDNFPGPGEPGAAGQSGCAAVFWDK